MDIFWVYVAIAAGICGLFFYWVGHQFGFVLMPGKNMVKISVGIMGIMKASLKLVTKKMLLNNCI